MIIKKLCIIGDFAVGKTSLISQFVHNEFSEKYVTTVGLKIDTKIVTTQSGEQVKMILWDIEGSSSLTKIKSNYIKGADGFLLVGDSTRSETVDHLYSLRTEVEAIIGTKPFITLINKIDLVNQLAISQETYAKMKKNGFKPKKTSAKSGEGVEESFLQLAEALINLSSG